jgi:hypothetical protein
METEEIIKYLFTSYILSEKQAVLCRSGHFLWKECVAQKVCVAKWNVQVYHSVVTGAYKSSTWLINSCLKWEINNKSN